VGRYGIAFLLLLAAPAAAQQTKDNEASKWKLQSAGKTIIEAANGLSWEEGGLQVTFLTGGVTVERPDLRLQAGRVMMWKRKDSPEPYDEIYAEGNVIFTREGQKLNAERFFFSNLDKRGAIVDVRLKAYSKDLKSDFFAMASEARIDAEMGKMVADDVHVTSCSYGVPHYHLTVAHATLLGADQPKPEGKKVSFQPFGDDWTVDFDELIPEFSGIPFFYVPGLSLGPWLMNFPLRGIRGGHSNLFGNYIYSDLGSRIRFKDDNGKLHPWGDVDLKIDWRQLRGEAAGIELRYKWTDYQGFLDSYYLHDKGRPPGSEFDAQLPPVEHADRGKAHWFHRQELDEHWRLELEAYYLSDSSFLEEFFPTQFKEEKEPETAAYLRWLDGNLGGFLEARIRLNDFQTQDQYLPRVDFNIFALPVLGSWVDNVYLTERLDVVDIRRKFEEDFNLHSVDTWRVDLESEVLMPLDFRFFQVAPFVQNRITYYQSDIMGDPRTRDLWTAGTRVTAQIHGTQPDLTWERVGLRGLRHVIEVEARYTNSFFNTVNAADLFPYEPVDQIGRFEEVAFEVRQRFLTKDPANKPFEFATLTVGIEYYPNSLRDTTSANVSNYFPPFNYIPLTANPATGVYERRSWSNLNYDFSLRPRNLFTLHGSGEYNPLTHAEEVREVGFTVVPAEGFVLSAAQTRIKGVTDAFSLGMTWALTPKWSVSVSGQYDFRAASYLSQNLVVARDFHDFAIEVVFERNFTRDENRFLVALVPKFLGASGERRSHLYRPGGLMAVPSDR
jgi:lipopolysaccharide assembly outer membrane protein LptD (OstA)